MKLEMDDDRESRAYLCCINALAAVIIGLDSPAHAAGSKQAFLAQLDGFLQQAIACESDVDRELIDDWRETLDTSMAKFVEAGHKMMKWH